MRDRLSRAITPNELCNRVVRVRDRFQFRRPRLCHLPRFSSPTSHLSCQLSLTSSLSLHIVTCLSTGVVLPRILDHLRTYLTVHGGVKLPGIFCRTPDSMLCYAIRQQINGSHQISAKASNAALMCVSHLIKVCSVFYLVCLFSPSRWATCSSWFWFFLLSLKFPKASLNDY